MNASLRSQIDRLTTRMEKLPTGRRLLAVMATAACSLITRRPIRISWHDNCWFRRDAGLDLPLGAPLRLYSGSVQRWKAGGKEILQERGGWWFRHYQPSAGDFVVDVGAGRGEDVFVLHQAVGSAGHVVAVEAHPATAAILRNFVIRNQLANVEVHQLAAAQQAGMRLISAASEDEWQCASILCDAGEPTPAVRLDDLPSLRAAKKIDFLKMNIEGAEAEALRGATSMLKKTDSACICCHDFLGEKTRTKSTVCALLETAGFRLRFSPLGALPYEQDFVYGER